MSEKHEPRERYQLYMMGWKRGAAAGAWTEAQRADSDFWLGYSEGRTARSVAADEKAEELGITHEERAAWVLR